VTARIKDGARDPGIQKNAQIFLRNYGVRIYPDDSYARASSRLSKSFLLVIPVT